MGLFDKFKKNSQSLPDLPPAPDVKTVEPLPDLPPVPDAKTAEQLPDLPGLDDHNPIVQPDSSDALVRSPAAPPASPPAQQTATNDADFDIPSDFGSFDDHDFSQETSDTEIPSFDDSFDLNADDMGASGEAPVPLAPDDAVSDNSPPVSKPEPIKPKGPIFVRVDDFRELIDVLDAAKHELDGCFEIGTGLLNTTTSEIKAVEKLQNELMFANRKLYVIDEKLFERG